MSLGFLQTMRDGLTPPYSRGLETLTLTTGATGADGTTAVEAYDFGAYQDVYTAPPPSPGICSCRRPA